MPEELVIWENLVTQDNSNINTTETIAFNLPENASIEQSFAFLDFAGDRCNLLHPGIGFNGFRFNMSSRSLIACLL